MTDDSRQQIGFLILSLASGAYLLSETVVANVAGNLSDQATGAALRIAATALRSVLLLIGVVAVARRRSGLGRGCIVFAGALVLLEVAGASFWFWGRDAHGPVISRFGWALNLGGLMAAVWLILLGGGLVFAWRFGRQHAVPGLALAACCLFAVAAVLPLFALLSECGRMLSLRGVHGAERLLLPTLCLPMSARAGLRIGVPLLMVALWVSLAVIAKRRNVPNRGAFPVLPSETDAR